MLFILSVFVLIRTRTRTHTRARARTHARTLTHKKSKTKQSPATGTALIAIFRFLVEMQVAKFSSDAVRRGAPLGQPPALLSSPAACALIIAG